MKPHVRLTVRVAPWVYRVICDHVMVHPLQRADRGQRKHSGFFPGLLAEKILTRWAYALSRERNGPVDANGRGRPRSLGGKPVRRRFVPKIFLDWMGDGR